MKEETEKIEALFYRGIRLHDFGVNNWILDKNQALDVINELETLKIPILGGDIYEFDNGIPRPNYDNWYCDRQSGESWDDYVYRSINHSRTYINNYHNPSRKDVYFALVVKS